MEKELTPKQQTSEAIRQADTILIMTAQRPSVDQVASTMALAVILRKLGKKVTAVISDDLPAGAKFLPGKHAERTVGGLRDFIMELDLSHGEVDTVKYTTVGNKLNIQVTPSAGSFTSKDVNFSYGDYGDLHFDLVIILGVASYARIDRAYAQNGELLQDIPIANIDIHRGNEQYGAINLVEPAAASLAEVLIALSESLQSGLIDAEIATIMLTGIMSATDRFTASHTTAKTMTVAAQMMALGADQPRIVRGLYRPDSKNPQKVKSEPAPQSQPRPRNEERQAPVRQEQPAPQPVQPAVTEPAPAPIPEPEPTPITEELPPVQNYDEPNLPTSAIAQPAVAAPTTPVPEPELPEPMVQPDPEPQPEPMPEPVSQPVPEPTPEPAASPDDDLLPPQHTEAALATEPEPLINAVPDTAASRLVRATPPRPKAAPNPTNNPNFAMRLDEFEL